MCACHRDFITALPVSEGMMTSGASAADVRQALTCVLAIVVSAAGAACAVAKRSTSRLLVDVVEKSFATVQPAVLHALWPSRQVRALRTEKGLDEWSFIIAWSITFTDTLWPSRQVRVLRVES